MSVLTRGRVLSALAVFIATGCSSSRETAPAARERPDEARSHGGLDPNAFASVTQGPDLPAAEPAARVPSCARACTHLRALTLAELEKTIAALPAETAQKLRAEADSSAESDHETCVSKCDGGGFEAGCVENLLSIQDLHRCWPEGDRNRSRGAYAAVAEDGARQACGRFLEAVEAQESCDLLATKLDEVASALQKGVSNHTSDSTIDRCLTVALEQRCKGSAAYESSNRYLTGAIMAMP